MRQTKVHCKYTTRGQWFKLPPHLERCARDGPRLDARGRAPLLARHHCVLVLRPVHIYIYSKSSTPPLTPCFAAPRPQPREALHPACCLQQDCRCARQGTNLSTATLTCYCCEYNAKRLRGPHPARLPPLPRCSPQSSALHDQTPTQNIKTLRHCSCQCVASAHPQPRKNPRCPCRTPHTAWQAQLYVKHSSNPEGVRSAPSCAACGRWSSTRSLRGASAD